MKRGPSESMFVLRTYVELSVLDFIASLTDAVTVCLSLVSLSPLQLEILFTT